MKKTSKKWLSVLLVFGMLIMPGIGTNLPVRVRAEAEGDTSTTLTFISTQTISVNSSDDGSDNGTYNLYTKDTAATQTGTIQVQDSTDGTGWETLIGQLTSSNELVYKLNSEKFTEGYQLRLVATPEGNYSCPEPYTYGGKNMEWSDEEQTGTLILPNSIESITENKLSFAFASATADPTTPTDTHKTDPVMTNYPINANFETEEVRKTDDNLIIVMPEEYTSTVKFTASIFKRNDETIEPYTDQETGGDKIDLKLKIEGIANLDEINSTVEVSEDKMSINILQGFKNYGKVILHVADAEVPEGQKAIVNQMIGIYKPGLINLTASAPLTLSQSFGTAALNQAIITNDETKDVSIFFGNSKTTLKATGENVKAITKVAGAKADINEDGTATITLPGLDEQTTTPVSITIEKTDKTTIERKVNIVRTAIQLQHNYGGEDDTVYAGYVVNKSYLYNNQKHDDTIFNAYLQVILYKDDIVMGYKQIKIDDENLINNLQDDQSGSLELYSENQIAVYGKKANGLIDGVNKVSVFLTNGPIGSSSDTLPSIEFGIGSGITCEWEAKK